MRIRNRVLWVMISLLFLVTAGFTVLIYQVQYRSLQSGIDAELHTAAIMARELLPQEFHDRISGKNSVSDAEYQQIVDRFNHLCVQADLEYLWSLMILDGKVVFTSATSPSKDASLRDQADFLEVHSNPELYARTFETMQPQYQINDDKWGRIRTVLIPYYDSHGRKYLIGASRSMKAVDDAVRATLISSLLAGGGVLVLGTLFCMLLARSFARPIEAVTNAAAGIAAGNYDQELRVSGGKEIELLGASINSMSRAIRDRMRELDDSREKLQITLQSIGDAVIATDGRGMVMWMNPVAETLTGWTQAGALNRPLGEVFRVIDSGTLQPLESPVEVVLREGRAIEQASSATLVEPNGRRRQIANSAAPIRDRTGAMVGVVLVFRDISERMQAEAALQATSLELESFFSVNLDLLCIADVGGHFRRLNKAWESTLGYTMDELLQGKFTDFVHPDDFQATVDATTTLAMAGKIRQFTNRFRCKDGTYRWIEWNSYPAEDLIYAAARDITERKLAEQALRESEEKYRSLFANMSEGLAVHTVEYDADHRAVDYVFDEVNPAFEQILKSPA